jgi:ferredoxin--NADP+ reductase/benzoate/toluate 1,2-dioxygenase reductase subunit
MGASSADVKVLANLPLGPGGFLLTFERPGLKFQTGQYLSLGLPGHREQREYSIYSGEGEASLTVLIKEVPEGLVSRRLAALVPGDRLHVDGPFGYFTLDQARKSGAPLLFLATGTGISPFHSFVATHPELDYTLLHGVRHAADLALGTGFDSSKLIACVSRENAGDFHGRVTERLRTLVVDPRTHAFLCGNCDMIYEAFDLLRSAGVASDRISTEVYF